MPIPTSAQTQFTLAEWLAEGEKRFGSDKMKWKFVCPSCRHVQSIEDFRPFKDKGATTSSAHSECIGRYDGMKREAFGDPSVPGPCNYAGYGLIDMRPVTVLTPEGDIVRCFAFAESA